MSRESIDIFGDDELTQCIPITVEFTTMPQLTLELPVDQLQELLFQLPPRDFLALADKIQDRAETMVMTRLAETGFRDWEHEEEDIYEATPETS